ncbi:hypothetical protein [Photobacterium leiognathi]|uniref:hypothetical protein n=1 Tax=Photobacterium leiognathi TaxID=553611 RepID=UPI0029820607|nr:hypothetical protein [Photobacterium leiognathi]
MKKAIVGVLLGLMAMTSLPAQADKWGDWGEWGARQKGRVERAAICGRDGYIFRVRDAFYVAKYQSGKRFAVGVPVKSRFGRNKWVKIEGIKNDGHYILKGKYYSIANAKAQACNLW